MFLLIVRLPGWNLDPAAADVPGTPTPPPAPTPRWRRFVAAAGRTFEPRHFLRTAWSMRPVTALIVAGLVALPWYVMVWQQTDGEWVRRFIGEHNVGRATQAMEGHGGSLLTYPLMIVVYYPLAVLAGFFPWSVLIVPILIDLVQRVRRRDPWAAGYVFAACWVGVFVVIFSIPRTKLPSYITPMYPGLSLIAGAFLYQWTRGLAVAPQKSVTDALRLMAGLGIAAVAGLAFGAWYMFKSDLWLGVIGLIPLAGGLIALRYATGGRLRAAGRAYGGMAVAFALFLFAVVIVRLDHHQHSHRLLAAIYAESATPDIATFRRLEPSWVFYAGQRLEDKKAMSDAVEFLRNPDSFILTSDEHYAALKENLPPGVRVLAEVPYFGRKDKTLYALGLDDSNDPPAPADGERSARAQ